MANKSFADQHVPARMSLTEADAALHGASQSSDPPPDRPKAVLFCPNCGHEGHTTADWASRDDYVAGTRAVVCPECAATITERPLPTQSVNAVDRGGRWAATGTRMAWETWRDLWRSSFELVTSWPRGASPPGLLSTR